VVNDIHGELIQFWSVLRSDEWFDLLLRTVEATPFSESMFDGCPVDNPSEMRTNEQLTRACVARAYRFFIRARQSRQGLMKDFATLSRNRTRRGMNEQVSSWLTAIEGLPDVHKRMKRVVILNRDAISVINTQDGPSTVFYLDPPYLHETRRTTQDYEYEMSPESHTQLLLKLRDIKGKFLLSGYRSELYDATASGSNWKRHEFGIVNNASSKKQKTSKQNASGRTSRFVNTNVTHKRHTQKASIGHG